MHNTLPALMDILFDILTELTLAEIRHTKCDLPRIDVIAHGQAVRTPKSNVIATRFSHADCGNSVYNVRSSRGTIIRPRVA